MKYLLFLTTSFIFSANILGQNVSYKNLIGRWEVKDTSGNKIIYTFLNDSSLIMDYKLLRSAERIDNTIYALKENGNLSTIIITANDFDTKSKSLMLIKLVNTDTLKIQIPNMHNPDKWSAETNNTQTLVRIK